mmetsp:Transcript_27890/g.66412  ORF Transcript_27890/g.66412 Transcript_27890/m.66412 type:complete len:216 (-) Transcript_27890:732-1379(-)
MHLKNLSQNSRLEANSPERKWSYPTLFRSAYVEGPYGCSCSLTASIAKYRPILLASFSNSTAGCCFALLLRNASRSFPEKTDATSLEIGMPFIVVYFAKRLLPMIRPTLHIIESLGRLNQKCSRALMTPPSAFILAARAIADSFISAFVSVFSFSTSISTVKSFTGQGFGPTPARRTTSPHMNWSPKKGQTNVGRPYRSPAAVVPAPPWCITAAH